ncbi:type II toxin-antitoxin system PemK/MazF family toxin [Methylobacillus gramineus]|uniref:type II toxin-antitoxin system PemK/MazF family toxin n=1 Tax=Methylobacillus gramineus TaxID=755169 RepID=UPI001CFFE98E|nr:type II toxin-antitoxin system PemK/MazF family toxin [Methylobacillus gramineus]MCB5185560.1 type II toxin-antitoxin system PemK/MazF family toxin [Methylobacillus gramineus]
MQRGDLITIALQGAFGKPRPALVIQADQFNEHPTITVLPVTSALVEAPLLRVSIHPDQQNGLDKPSQVMIDKTVTITRHKAGEVFGRIDATTMVEVQRCLAVFLGIA